MLSALLHVISMSSMIQIRNVPEKTHRKIKARAATEGMTLSDFLLREIESLLERPVLAETVDRIRARQYGAAVTAASSAEDIREERDNR